MLLVALIARVVLHLVLRILRRLGLVSIVFSVRLFALKVITRHKVFERFLSMFIDIGQVLSLRRNIVIDILVLKRNLGSGSENRGLIFKVRGTEAAVPVLSLGFKRFYLYRKVILPGFGPRRGRLFTGSLNLFTRLVFFLVFLQKLLLSLVIFFQIVHAVDLLLNPLIALLLAYILLVFRVHAVLSLQNLI